MNEPILGDEKDWFRPPMLRQLGSLGDTENWMWIAEPVLGTIYGVSYKIAASLEWDEAARGMVHAEARRELDRRMARRESIPEASHADAMAWHPVMKRKGNFLVFVGVGVS